MPVAYKIRPYISGWPACPRAEVATGELLQEAEKFSLDQPIAISVPHQVLSLLELQENRWLTAGRIGRHQVVLWDNPNVTLKTESTLNPGTLLPDPDSPLLLMTASRS